jgi:hypothetical protein
MNDLLLRRTGDLLARTRPLAPPRAGLRRSRLGLLLRRGLPGGVRRAAGLRERRRACGLLLLSRSFFAPPFAARRGGLRLTLLLELRFFLPLLKLLPTPATTISRPPAHCISRPPAHGRRGASRQSQDPGLGCSPR